LASQMLNGCVSSTSEKEIKVNLVVSPMKREKLYSRELKARELDSFYWTAPGGESIAQACLRVDRFLEIIRHSCSGFKMVCVCHGNIMRAFRIRLERMQQSTFKQLWAPELLDENHNTAAAKAAEIYNCHILWYTRRDPNTLEVGSNFKWLKSICPWHPDPYPEWQPINRPSFSNEKLMMQVMQIPQILNNTKQELEQAKELAKNPDLLMTKKDRARSRRRMSITWPPTTNDGESSTSNNSSNNNSNNISNNLNNNVVEI